MGYLIAALVLREMNATTRLTIEREGIRKAPRANIIPWTDILSCEETAGSGALIVKIRDGEEIVLSRLSIANYNQVREIVASHIEITREDCVKDE